MAEIVNFEDARVRADDHLVRGTAADGQIRAFAITAQHTVEAAHQNHHTSPLVSAALGRLIMGATMMGAMNKVDDQLITLTVRGDGPIGTLMVTANNRGQVKGFATHPNVWLPLRPDQHLNVGAGVGAGELSAVFDTPGTVPYSSQVELVTGEIGDDLTNYFVLSDQVPTSVGVGVLVDVDTSIRQAGGFIIQMMPGYDEYILDDLEHNLTNVKSVTELLEAGMSPSDMLGYLLRGLDYQELEVMPVEFYCGCNTERAARATLALGREELEDMIAKHEPADVYCHFCGKHHHFSPDELQDLLTDKNAS